MQNAIELNALELMFSNLRDKYNFDLSNYAPASLERRLIRFQTLHYFKNITELQNKLISDSNFFDLFVKEITVNTTEMFRDPACWKAIRENVIPLLMDLPSLRIWHAGCSSGEEVYSMSILLKEAGVYHKTKIIATDINKEIIETAKNGRYPVKSLDLNQENYLGSGGTSSLSAYYTLTGDSSYLMNNDLLENVRFLKHDLSTGSNFSKFDIIICRNVLIYFNKVLQEKVFSLFQESLFKKGHMIIGKKESMAYYTNSRMFTEQNPTEKIYQLK